MEIWIFWLIAFLLLAVIEVITQWLTTFCFAVGCLVALILSAMGVPSIYQLLALGLAALISFFCFAPYFQRLHQKKGNTSKSQSNMDALIGRNAMVTVEIPANGLGRVKVDGDSWQAKSVDGTEIAASTKVKILNYDSIVLIVRNA